MSKRQKDKDDIVKDKKWRKQEFLVDYSEKWPALVASEKGPTWCKIMYCVIITFKFHTAVVMIANVMWLGLISGVLLIMQILSFHDCASLLKIQFLVIKISCSCSPCLVSDH
jgi:hypothetical protein